MKRRILTLILALIMCLGLAVPAMADTIHGPKDVGFMLAAKLYPFDKTASGEGWSYDGNYTFTFSGIKSTYGVTETGIISDGISFYNPKKDINIVVKDGTENNIGTLSINFYTWPKEADLPTFNFSGSGSLKCKKIELEGAPVTVKDVTIDSSVSISLGSLTMTSGNIKGKHFSLGSSANSLVGKFNVTGGTIELTNDEAFFGVLTVSGKEESLIAPIISQFKDSSGNPLQPKINESKFTDYSTGNSEVSYYADAKVSGTDEYAAYAIFGGTAPSTPAQPAAGTFSDVVPGSYYADPVKWAVEKGITNGTSETTFSPEATCTRGQIITFLWRAVGSPEPVNALPFSDVDANAFYAKAAAWAAENGLVDGTVDFEPEAPCTREMAVEFMWKHAGSPSAANASSFIDVFSAAVNWAVEKGVTNGTSDTTFSPELTCTRAQIVTFLWRAFGK